MRKFVRQIFIAAERRRTRQAGLVAILVLTALIFSATLAYAESNDGCDEGGCDTTPPVFWYLYAWANCKGADVIWYTDEPTTGSIEYSQTSGGPYQTVEDQTLTYNHNKTLVDLEAGKTYYYRVTATDAAGNSTTSGENSFQTPSGPDLSIKASSRWASYSDYLMRRLSVDYQIVNSGWSYAVNVKITESSADSGVTLLTPTPVAVGNIYPGSSAQVTLEYQIPAGVYSFKANTNLSAQGDWWYGGDCGYQYSFDNNPRVPLLPSQQLGVSAGVQTGLFGVRADVYPPDL